MVVWHKVEIVSIPLTSCPVYFGMAHFRGALQGHRLFFLVTPPLFLVVFPLDPQRPFRALYMKHRQLGVFGLYFHGFSMLGAWWPFFCRGWFLIFLYMDSGMLYSLQPGVGTTFQNMRVIMVLDDSDFGGDLNYMAYWHINDADCPRCEAFSLPSDSIRSKRSMFVR